MPDRIQRTRKKGSKLPADCVCVTRPGPFGNPFVVDPVDGKLRFVKCVKLFRKWLNLPAQRKLRKRVKDELEGKGLACWCPLDQPCHANVLIHVANQQGTGWRTPLTNRECERCGRREGCTRDRSGEEDGVPLGELEKCPHCGRMACPDCHHERDCCDDEEQ